MRRKGWWAGAMAVTCLLACATPGTSPTTTRSVTGAGAAVPPARAHHRLVTVPGAGVRLVGGSTRADTGYAWFDDTWTHRAGAWRPGPALPFRRSSHALAWDRARSELFLLGGVGGRGTAADGTVWVEDESGWSARHDVPGEGWAEPAACYDRERERVVVFGGWDAHQELRGDTWEWDGMEMRQVADARSGPGPRAGHEIAWDPVGARCLLFGGRTATGLKADTWAWDGASWVRLDAEGPPPRWFFGMTAADDRDVVVLYGGTAEDEPLADTWIWDGTTWTQVDVPGPPARGMSRIAFDGERVVLFGGRRPRADPPEGEWSFEDMADTWLFDGREWARGP